MYLSRLQAKSLICSIFVHCLFLFFLQKNVFVAQKKDARTFLSDKKSPVLKEVHFTMQNQSTIDKQALQKKPIAELQQEIYPIDTIDSLPTIENQQCFQQISNLIAYEWAPPSISLELEKFEVEMQKVEIPFLQEANIKKELSSQNVKKEKNKELAFSSPTFTPPTNIPDRTVDLSYELPASTWKFTPPIDKQKELTAQEAVKNSFPSPHELNTALWAEKFDYSLVYYPDGEEYIFFLTMQPKEGATFDKLKQNIYFLVDKSNAIQSTRLKATAQGIARSLSYFSDQDRIHILTFDNKMNRHVSYAQNHKQNKKKIRKFLHEIQIGNLLSSADPYTPLQSILFDKPEEGIDMIIYLSNGDGLTSRKKQPYFLHEWTAKNQGRFHLYAAGLSIDKNQAILDLFCKLNKGSLSLSSTLNGLKRKVQKIAQSISYPIAKELMVNAAPYIKESSIEIYPSGQMLSALFYDEPLVLWGKTKNLCDFVLFVQGRTDKQWINIKKVISFSDGQLGEESMLKQWAVQKSYHCYENYLKDRDPKHLAEAEKILAPYQINPAF